MVDSGGSGGDGGGCRLRHLASENSRLPRPNSASLPHPRGGREGRNVARAGETEKAKRARARVSRQAAFARLREIKVRIGSRGFVRPAKRPLAAKSRVTEKRRPMLLVGKYPIRQFWGWLLNHTLSFPPAE